MQDDPRKKATPPAKPHTASYKSGRKTEVTSNGGKIGRKNLLTQDNAHLDNPLSAMVKGEQKKYKGKEPRLDPFMVRQAKLKAKQQA